MILIYFKLGFSPWTYAILVIGGIIVFIQIYTGKKRRNELLTSERLFCLSVMDRDVAKAFDEISDIIIRRDRQSGEESSDLGPRL